MIDSDLPLWTWRTDLPAEADTETFGRALAKAAKPGDIFALSGPLGAGKTALARGFIRRLTSPGQDVPSPTYTLIQTYDTSDGEVWHVDLYRLDDPDEADQLGLEEAFGSAITLIEWPERLGRGLPEATLHITIEPTEYGRAITLSGLAGWGGRLSLDGDAA